MDGKKNASSIEEFGYEQKLQRTLTTKDLIIFGMLFMVPVAPMGVFGYVAQASSGMVPLVYLVGAIAMLFTALSYVKMSKRFPIAGSVFAYVQRGINPHVGWVAGWLIMLDYIMIPALLYAFVGVWASSLVPWIPVWAFVVSFVLINTVINYFGIEVAKKAQMGLLALQLVSLVIFLVVGIVFIANGGGTGGLSIAPFYAPDKINLHFLATACSIAVLSFLGFDGVSTLAEETKDPQRTVGRATIITLIIAAGLYILQTYVAALAAPHFQALNPDTGFFDLAATIGGPWLRIVLLVTHIIGSGIASSMVAQASISRILFSMSRDKLIPSFFGTVHEKYKSPYLSIIFIAIFSMIVALIVPIGYLVKLVNFGALSSFMMLNFTVFWLFFVKEKQRSFKDLINYVLLPFAGFGIILFLWMGFDKLTLTVGGIWLVVGIIIGFIKSKGYKEVPTAFQKIKV